MTESINPERRSDILVSVCFTELPVGDPELAGIERLVERLNRRFRYWEILVAAYADLSEGDAQRLWKVPNLRLLRLRRGSSFYRRRAAVAYEAIGDVVVLASIDELPFLDLVVMIETAEAAATIVTGHRPSSSLVNPLLAALGRSAGFRVDARYMLTAAFPRTVLNQLLAHPDRQLALRFPPSDIGAPLLYPARAGTDGPQSLRGVGRRLALLQRLLVSSAPRVLTFVGLFSLLVTVSALAFAIYVVAVWLILRSIQPGWFTTSLALSLTTVFLGTAIFGISIGLQKTIEQLSPDAVGDIIDETGSSDLFGQVLHELNVETNAVGSTEPAAPAPERPSRGAS